MSVRTVERTALVINVLAILVVGAAAVGAIKAAGAFLGYGKDEPPSEGSGFARADTVMPERRVGALVPREGGALLAPGHATGTSADMITPLTASHPSALVLGEEGGRVDPRADEAPQRPAAAPEPTAGLREDAFPMLFDLSDGEIKPLDVRDPSALVMAPSADAPPEKPAPAPVPDDVRRAFDR